MIRCTLPLLLLAACAAPPRGSVALHRTAMDPNHSGRAAAPRMLAAVPPPYPETALRARRQGEVWVEIEVAEDGRVRNARFRKASGFADLDEAALLAARAFRYPPGRAWTDVIRVTFTIE